MAFVLFLLVNFVLLVRPTEIVPAMAGWKLYEATILACLVVSVPHLLAYLTGKSLDAQPITLCVLGLFAAAILSNLTQFKFGAMLEGAVEFGKLLVYYLLLASV